MCYDFEKMPSCFFRRAIFTSGQFSCWALPVFASFSINSPFFFVCAAGGCAWKCVCAYPLLFCTQRIFALLNKFAWHRLFLLLSCMCFECFLFSVAFIFIHNNRFIYRMRNKCQGQVDWNGKRGGFHLNMQGFSHIIAVISTINFDDQRVYCASNFELKQIHKQFS